MDGQPTTTLRVWAGARGVGTTGRNVYRTLTIRPWPVPAAPTDRFRILPSVSEGFQISYLTKLTTLAATVLIAFGAWQYAVSGPQHDRGVFADPSVVDFGETPQNTERFATVTLHNNSSDPIEIVGFAKRCDCTDATVDSSIVQPDGTSTVRLMWNTRMDRGDVGFTIMVLCQLLTDPERTFSVPIECHGRVVPKYTYSPDSIGFRLGNSAEVTVTFVCDGPESGSGELLISVMWTTHRSLRIRKVERGKLATVTVAFDASQWVGGPAEASVVIRIDPSSGGGTLLLPVRVGTDSPKADAS